MNVLSTTPAGASDRDDWRALQEAEDAGAFFDAWLRCLVSRLEGVGQAVLVWADAANVGPFHPAAVWPEGAAPSSELAALCERALALRLPMHQSAAADVFAYPVMAGGDLHGVVALATAQRLPEQAVLWLRWGVGWLLEQAARSAPGAEGQVEEGFVLTLDLLTRVLEADNARDAAQAVLTEAAQRLGCERVSLGFGDLRGLRLFGLSHSADFARRIDLASAIEAAMDECADQGVTIRLGLPGESEGEAQALMVREHQRLQRDYDALAVISVPFRFGDTTGVLLFEWSTPAADAGVYTLAAGIVPIVGQALAERRRLGRPWPVRLAHGARSHWRKLVGPRHAGRKLAVLAGTALAAYLAVAVGEFKIAAPSRLEGAVRRVIVAPFDGFIGSSQFRAGQVVEKGAVLATLDDRDLRLEASRWDSQSTQYHKQAQDALAQRNVAQMQISLAQTRQAAAQRQLSAAMMERSRIKAPFEGVVVSGDLSQKLGAAVKKGDVLYEIAPLDHYRVILEVEEADIRHVQVGQSGELILAALPAQTFPFAVRLVTPVAVAREGRNFFRVEASLDGHAPKLRPGMEGVAKIHAGTHARVWIWTRRFVDWLRLKSWVWLGV